MFFKMSYQPMLEDFTPNGALSLFAILKIFENNANKQADFVNDSVFTSEERKRFWVIMDWHIEIGEYPHYGDEIESSTWMHPLSSPITCTRDFLLYRNGVECAKGISRWILADMNTGRPTKLGKDVTDAYQPEAKHIFTRSKPPKIEIPEQFISETSIRIRRADFDFNNHIHNLTYFDYALEAIPKELYNARSFTKLWMSYKDAITDGDTVMAKYREQNGQHLVCIFGDDGQFKSSVLLE